MPDRERIPCPAPGLYSGIPAETYHAWDAASNSILSVLSRSPAHALCEMLTPREATPATTRGDALHLAVLEPHLLAERYVVLGRCAGTVKSGPNAGEYCRNDATRIIGGAHYCGVHGKGPSEDPRTVLTAADWADCEGMRDAVRRHPAAADLLDAATERELSVVFYWPGTTVLCKARIDIPAFAAAVIGDVKSTTDASADGFARTVWKYGYHRQAAFYQAAARALDLEVSHSVFVAVESMAPYGVGVYRVEDEAVVASRHQLEKLIATWERCRRTGEWPGYPDTIMDISLPAYAWDRLYSGSAE